jgi:hypothetical protein
MLCLHLVLSFPQLESCFPGALPRAEPTASCNYKCAGMKLFSEARKTKLVAYTGQFGQAIISIKSHSLNPGAQPRAQERFKSFYVLALYF